MKESSLVAVVFVAALALGGGTLAAQISSQPEPPTDVEAQAAPQPVCTVPDRSQLVPESGALYGVNLDWDAWCGPMGKRNWDPKVFARWRRYRDYSTGIIGDLLVHEITPMLMAIEQGWPTRVVATGSHLVDKEMENFDQQQ